MGLNHTLALDSSNSSYAGKHISVTRLHIDAVMDMMINTSVASGRQLENNIMRIIALVLQMHVLQMGGMQEMTSQLQRSRISTKHETL